MVTFNHLPSECNPSDLLSKHWGHAQVWQLLQPILFWKGDTRDLCNRNMVPTGKKGSDKCSVQTGPKDKVRHETEQSTTGTRTVTSGSDMQSRD